MKLLSLNIERNAHLPEVEALLGLKNPDIACFQEITRSTFMEWREERFRDGIFIAMVSENNLPFGEWGIAILSQSPLLHTKSTVYDAFTVDYPEFQGKRLERPLATVTAVTCKAQPDLVVATTHFTWSKGGEVTDEQRVNIQRMLQAVKPYQQLVLCGDFNAPRGGEIFELLSSCLTDHIPATWTTTIDPHLHRAGALQLVVDGLFSRGDISVSDCKRVCGVSDHCAIVATIEPSTQKD